MNIPLVKRGSGLVFVHNLFTIGCTLKKTLMLAPPSQTIGRSLPTYSMRESFVNFVITEPFFHCTGRCIGGLSVPQRMENKSGSTSE